MSHSALLLRACDCYARAGGNWLDAARTAHAANDLQRAARFYERARRHAEAGALFREAGLWSDAARCYVTMNDYAAASDCAGRAGHHHEAIWYLALAGASAEALEAAASTVSAEDRLTSATLAAALALAADTHAPSVGAAHLRRGISALRQIGEFGIRRLTESRLVYAAEMLRRPDLAAEIFAASLLDTDEEAAERWRVWAESRGACAPGPPNNKDTAHD